MIVENAFLKLPELLTSSYDHGDTYEATVVHFLSVAVLMELNARNISQPYQYTFTEKPYPIRDKKNQIISADMMVDLTKVAGMSGRMTSYGIREKNWIEAKAFLTSTRSKSGAPTIANAGKVFRDLLRLCILPEELQGRIRQNGRYFLLVCSDPASKYLAIKGKDWLHELLSEGYSKLSVNLPDEPESLRREVGPGFLEVPDLRAEFHVRTMAFQPDVPSPSPIFWGYLARILHFGIATAESTFEFDDREGELLDEKRIESLKSVRQSILARF